MYATVQMLRIELHMFTREGGNSMGMTRVLAHLLYCTRKDLTNEMSVRKITEVCVHELLCSFLTRTWKKPCGSLAQGKWLAAFLKETGIICCVFKLLEGKLCR